MADARPILIIANPTSGKGRGRFTAEAVRRILSDQGRSVHVCYTKQSGDAGAIAQQACSSLSKRSDSPVRHRKLAGENTGLEPVPNMHQQAGSSDAEPPACIVACGGDGTIQEVAHVLTECKKQGRPSVPALGLAPAGRCNDFARVFGITRDPAVIAESIMAGKEIAVDLGCVNGRHFCTVATVGIDAEISRFVDEMRMPLTGTPAYLYGALRVLMRYKPRGLRIEGDFGVIDKPVFLASTANTSSYGGAVPIAPNASPTDGLLDVCVIGFTTRWRALGMIPSVLRGRHTTRPGVSFERTRRLRIDAPNPLEIWADGEHIADTPANIDIVPAAIRVLSRRNSLDAPHENRIA